MIKRSIKLIDLQSGKEQIFSSVSKAAKFLDTSPAYFYTKKSGTHLGHKFEFIDPETGHDFGNPKKKVYLYDSNWKCYDTFPSLNACAKHFKMDPRRLWVMLNRNELINDFWHISYDEPRD